MMPTDPFVAVIMGSDSDLPVMQTTLDTLTRLGVKHEVKISSAHRTPGATHDYVRDAEERGCVVFIAAAGLAAHLAGTIASLTLRPVIGVPMDGGPLQGMDALLSTVQMPGGIPVGCMAIGKPGAKNAAYFAAQIVALCDNKLREHLHKDREAQAEDVRARDAALRRDDEGGES